MGFQDNGNLNQLNHKLVFRTKRVDLFLNFLETNIAQPALKIASHVLVMEIIVDRKIEKSLEGRSSFTVRN
jgi:hypothetical protein